MSPLERLIRGADRYQQRHRPLAFGFAVIKKFGDDRGSQLAALLAYNGFLALFPLLLLLVTVLGYVVGTDTSTAHAIVHSALMDFPIIGDQLGQAVHPLHGNLAALTIGALGLFWGALGVTQVAQHAMAQVWNVPGVVRPNFVTRLARSALLIVVLGVSVTAGTVLAGVATFGGASGRSEVLGIVASITVNVGMFIAAFRVATPRSVPTRDLVTGAVIGGVALAALQAAGGYLVGHQLRHASQVYGFFGSVLGLISWLYLGAQLALYAAEVNVVRAKALWPRSIVQPPLTAADEQTLIDIAKQEERRPEETVAVTFHPPVRPAS